MIVSTVVFEASYFYQNKIWVLLVSIAINEQYSQPNQRYSYYNNIVLNYSLSTHKIRPLRKCVLTETFLF